MGKVKSKNIKYNELFMGIIISIVAVLVFTSAISNGIENYNFCKNAEKTTAIIDKITTYSHRRNGMKVVYKKVHINYSVNDKKHENTLNFY